MSVERRASGLSSRVQAAWHGVSHGSRSGLSIEAILTAAAQLADVEGVDGLTIRKLGAQLGCSAMAVYRYVESRDELLLLTMDSALGWPPRDDAEGPWSDRLAAWTTGLYERYLAHPWLLDLPLPGLPVTPRHAAWVERLLAATDELALDEGQRLEAGLLLDGHARNIANLARAMQSKNVDGAELARELVSIMTESDYPRMVSVVLKGLLHDEAPPSIAFGVGVIIRGLTAQPPEVAGSTT